jgi:alginate O-acetyltransferase complex protein AlgI
MATATVSTNIAQRSYCRAWLPLFTLPALAVFAGQALPPWMQMWLLSAAVLLGLKWLTFTDFTASGQALAPARTAGYLLLWPGMDPERFFAGTAPTQPAPVEWCCAAMNTAIGLALLTWATWLDQHADLTLVGWLGMCGLIFVLHFGLFHLLSLAWRQAGVDARQIMEWPIFSTSLGEFWGRRWNRAFRDVAWTYVFRPLVRQVGPARATMAVFLVSGVVHDLVISLPARAGWGLPTLYFVIQGCGTLLEHSTLGKRLGLGRGIVGRLFCLVTVAAPLPLLFHPPFAQRVIVPMLTALAEIC